MVEEMQVLGPDLLEATAYARTMTQAEIEETIDYLLSEVLSPFVAIADLSLMFRTERSTRMILLAVTCVLTGLRDLTSMLSFLDLSPSRH
jgi:hypothetical protein